MKVITCCRSVTSSLDRPVQVSVDEKDMSSPLGKAAVRELPWDVKAPPINNDLSNGLLYDDISDDEEMFLRFSGGEDDDEETRVPVDGKTTHRPDIGPARDVKVCVDGQDDTRRTVCSDNDIKGHTSAERNMLCDDSGSEDVKVSSRSDDSNTHIPDKDAGLETMVVKTCESGLADDDSSSTLCHVDTEGVTNKLVKSRAAVNNPRLAEYSTSGVSRNTEQCHNLLEICVQKKENILKSCEESGCEMTIFDGPNKESCALGAYVDHDILEVHPTDKMILCNEKEGNIEADQDKAKSFGEDGVKVDTEKCISNFSNVEKTKGPMETKREGCIPPSSTAGPLEGETLNQSETQPLEETSEHPLNEPMETDEVELPSYGDKYTDHSTDCDNTHKESEANINIELSSPAVPCENQINLDGQSPFTILSGDCHTEESKTKVQCKIQVSGSESDDSKQVKKETGEENMTEITLMSSEKIVLGNEGEVTESLGIEACLERTEANSLIKRPVQNNENCENIKVLGNTSVEFPNKNKLCDMECETLNDCEELLKSTQTDVFCEPNGFEGRNESEITKEIPFLNNFDKVEATKQIDANASNDSGSLLEHEADLATKAQSSGQSDSLPLNCTDGTLQQNESMASWKGVECEGAKHEERDLDNIRTQKVLSSECHHNNKDDGNVVNINMVENINILEVESKSNLSGEAVSCQVDAAVPRPEETIFAHGGGEEELGGLSRGAALDLEEENLSRKRCSPTTKVVSDTKRLRLEDEDLCRVENHPGVEEREHVHEVEVGIPLPKRRKTTEDDFIMVFKEETCPDSQVQEETACKNNAPTPAARDVETLSGAGLDKCFALNGGKQSSLVDGEQVVTLGMFLVDKEQSLTALDNDKYMTTLDKGESLFEESKRPSLPVVEEEEGISFVDKEDILPALDKNKCITDCEEGLSTVSYEKCLPLVNKKESLLILNEVEGLPHTEEILPVAGKEESLLVLHKEESYPVVNKKESLLVLNQGENLSVMNQKKSFPVLNQKEGLLVVDKEESLAVVDKEERSIVVDKEESMPVVNKEESLSVVNKEESLSVVNKEESLPVVNKEESLPVENKEESLPVLNKEESLLVLDQVKSLPVVDEEESLMVLGPKESLSVEEKAESLLVGDKEEKVLVGDEEERLLVGDEEERLHVGDEGESWSFGNKEENLPVIGKEENLLAPKEQSLPVPNKGESWSTIEKSFLVADKKKSLLALGKEESLLVGNDYHSQPTSKENLSPGGAGEMLPVCNEDILLATYKEDNSNSAVNEVLDTTIRVKEDILSILKQDKLPSTDKHECLPSVEEDILLSAKSLPAVDKESLPTVDKESLPTIDKESLLGSDKESLLCTDKVSLLGAGKESLLGTDKKSLLGADKESLLCTDKVSLLGADKESLLGTDKESLLGADKESLLCTDKVSLLGAGKESLLGADKESLLCTDKVSLLGADKESLLGTDKESLLGADKESLLCTDKESLLGADKENLPALSQVEAADNSTLTASEVNEDSLHAMLHDEDSLLASDEEDTVTTRNRFALKVKGSIFGKIKESEVKLTRGEFSSDEDSFGGFPEELLLSADDLSDKDESTSFSADKNKSMSLSANEIESPVSAEKGKINSSLKGKEENLSGDADDTLSASEGKNETGLSSDDCSSKSTERPLDGDKRPATKGPSKGKDSGLLGKRRLESLRPEIIKVKKVRISPEVEKQLKNQAEKDALRKKEPAHSLPTKTPVTNLDFAIERVVSKAAVAAPGISDEERSIIMSYMKAFHKVTMSKMTRDDLEEMVMQKMCELIAHRSELGQNRQKIQSLELLNDQLRRKSLQLQKQAKDLHTVTQRLVNELRTRKDGKMTPVRLTRSVGLQVQVQTQPIAAYRGPGPELGPHGFISGGRVRKPPPITTSPPSAPPTIPISVSTPLTSSAQLARKLAVPPQSRVLPSTPTAGTTTTFVATTRVSVIAPPVPPSVKVSQPPIKVCSLPSSRPVKTTSRPSMSSGGPPTVRVQPMMLQNPPRLSPIKPTKDTSFIDLTDEEDKGRSSSASVRLVGSLPSSATVTSSSPLGGSIRVVQPHQLTGTTATLLTSTASGVGGQRLAYLLPTSSSAPGQSRQVYITSSTPSSLASAATVTQVRPTSNMVAVSRSNPLPTTLMFKGGAVIPVQQGGSPASSATILRAAGPTVQVAASPLQTALGRPSNPSIRVSSLGAVMNKFHPAPLPAAPPYQPSNNLWKFAPPKPDLKISRVTNNKPQPGIVLSWNMQTNEQYEEIASYQLYAYQETSAHPNTNLWKKVGDVKALPLPMACTLTQFMEGHKYHFAVRAVDIHTRVGPFSIPGNIVLTKK
uniref:Fibronectin type-III domain-containing protein n=1 Tax=Timema poppense TaxID=170557 RepID=A0A7R9CPG8_TIMPO|nr:unnamed protein product [Timema poppensis]